MRTRSAVCRLCVNLVALAAANGCLFSGYSAKAANDIFRLRSTGPGEEGLRNAVATGTVTSVSSHGPVLRTRTGILNLRWDNLHAEDADKAGRESGYFRVIDSRRTVMGDRGFELDLYIVSRQGEDNRTNHVVMARTVEHLRYRGKRWRGKEPKNINWYNYPGRDPSHIPEFLDDTTVGIPWEQVIMYRLTHPTRRAEVYEIRTHRRETAPELEINISDTGELMVEVVEPSIPYLLRTLSVIHGSMRAPRIIAQVTEYEIDKPYPDIPEWFMSPPNDMRISWYGNTYDFTLKPDFRGRNEWEIKPSMTPNEHSDMNAVPNASTQ